jgi:hypothetical protein
VLLHRQPRLLGVGGAPGEALLGRTWVTRKPLWADRLAANWSDDQNVLVYFNNDLGGHAIRNARTLKDLLARVR